MTDMEQMSRVRERGRDRHAEAQIGRDRREMQRRMEEDRETDKRDGTNRKGGRRIEEG